MKQEDKQSWFEKKDKKQNQKQNPPLHSRFTGLREA